MLTNEQELLILLNRLSFDEKVVERVSRIMMQKINWFELFKLSMYHKNATLCWVNLKKLCPDIAIPKYLNDIMECIYSGIIQRNQYYHTEIKIVIKTLKDRGVTIIPVKGAMLIPELYKDLGLRYSGDADFLVRYKDIDILDNILKNELGYIKGEYSSKTESVEPATRMEEIKWKVYMSNLFPYCKAVKGHLPLKYIKLDFRFALDDSRHYAIVDEIIDYYEKEQHVKVAHVLLHLCTHFYNEAKYKIAIELYKDLNLIKLCDIREYIYNFVNQDQLNELITLSDKYDLNQAVYYTFHWLNLLYEDGYEKEVLDNLKIDNLEFLTTFGDNTITNQKKFHRTELERLFSCDNVSELKEK